MPKKLAVLILPRSRVPWGDLTAARKYLHDLARTCEEGARTCDPRVTWLTLGVVARAGIELEASRNEPSGAAAHRSRPKRGWTKVIGDPPRVGVLPLAGAIEVR
jgi:hypothetical protein